MDYYIHTCLDSIWFEFGLSFFFKASLRTYEKSGQRRSWMDFLLRLAKSITLVPCGQPTSFLLPSITMESSHRRHEINLSTCGSEERRKCMWTTWLCYVYLWQWHPNKTLVLTCKHGSFVHLRRIAKLLSTLCGTRLFRGRLLPSQN